MSNKITVVVVGARTVQARLKPWGDIDAAMNNGLHYWRGRKWNGHVSMSDENKTWLRGWNHGKKTRDALVVSSAL
jgi:hypothetical protein